MKTNYLLLSAFFLFFLFGCDSDLEITPSDDSNVETTLPIDTDIETPPDDSSDLVEISGYTSTGILIEYLEKEIKGYLLLEGEELKARQNDRMEVEFISIIDEITGKSFKEPKKESLIRSMFGCGPESFEYYDKDPVVRHYVYKYKVPSIKGESIEEIKGIFHYFGGYGYYTEVWYNGKAVPLMDGKEVDALYPPDDSPDRYDKDVYERIMKETYYSGDLIAIRRQSSIYLVIPVE
jgi:hypothetical protein